MGVAMTVHGKHGGVAYIMDDYLVNQTREEQIENQRRMIRTVTEILERAQLRELAMQRELQEQQEDAKNNLA